VLTEAGIGYRLRAQTKPGAIADRAMRAHISIDIFL
jgi:hypothetical protein